MISLTAMHHMPASSFKSRYAKTKYGLQAFKNITPKL